MVSAKAKPNQKIGMLTYIGDVGTDYWGCKLVLLDCDCGRSTVMRRSDFLRGNIKSCGCLRRNFGQRMVEYRRMHA